MRYMIRFMLVIGLILILSTSSMAFTPTRYNYHYNYSYTTNGAHGNNPVSNTINHYSSYTSNAINMVGQDVTRAKTFIKERVDDVKNLKKRLTYKYRLIRDYGIPEAQRETDQFYHQSQTEINDMKEEYYQNKSGIFHQMKERAKANYLDIKQRIKEKVARRVPSVRQVIWSLENRVNQILRRGR